MLLLLIRARIVSTQSEGSVNTRIEGASFLVSQSGGDSQSAVGVDLHGIAQDVEVQGIPRSRHDSRVVDENINLRVSSLFEGVDETPCSFVLGDVHPVDHMDVGVVVEQRARVRSGFSPTPAVLC